MIVGIHRTSRGGVVLLTVLVLLAVSMIVLGLVAQSLTTTHRQSRLRHQQRQCRRLAEAGAERGRLLALRDASYQGETWSVGAADLHRPRGAKVEIKLDGRIARATSAWPADEPRIRHTVESLTTTPN